MTAPTTRKPMPPSGVLVVDKPRGPTSHDVVQRVRRALRTREVGHAGTLDPMATGVLVVAVGEATKLVPWLTAADKSYAATLELGTATDTLDAEGQIVETRVPPDDWSTRLSSALDAERSREAQIPPAFSAIKTDGVRSHERARRGEVVSLAPRPVSVRRLEARVMPEATRPWLALELTVAKGYYVRALARDLAAALGTVGHLTALRRTRSGAFTAEEAIAWEAPDLAAHLLGLADAAARALPPAQLTERGTLDARVGRRVAPEDLQATGPGVHAWLDPRGELVAVGEVEGDGGGRVLRGFTSSSSASL